MPKILYLIGKYFYAKRLIMEITFQSNKLQKIFSSPSSLLQKYGVDRGKAIKRRISFIRSARNLAEIPSEPPTRRHQLLGEKKGEEQEGGGFSR